MKVNGNIIEAVRTLAAVAADTMSAESEKLDAAQAVVEVPDLFNVEIGLVEKELETVRNILHEIQCDPMTTTRGKIRAANLVIKFEARILERK